MLTPWIRVDAGYSLGLTSVPTCVERSLASYILHGYAFADSSAGSRVADVGCGRGAQLEPPRQYCLELAQASELTSGRHETAERVYSAQTFLHVENISYVCIS